jgi:hypothetical protein
VDLGPLEAALNGGAIRRRRRSAPLEEPPDALVRPRPGRRTPPRDRRVVLAIAIVCGLACLAAPVEPTGLLLTDLVARFAIGLVVTLAAARARRSTWIVLAGGAAVLSHSGVWFVVALASLALAVTAAFLPRRRLLGAVVALLAVPSLLRAEEFGFTGASALCVWAVMVPVLVSGYRVASGRTRERILRTAGIVGAVWLFGIIVFALVSWIAWHDLSSGSTSAEAGLRDLRSGHGSAASVELASASGSLGSAHTILGGWWTLPAHLVPLVSQQLLGLSVASSQGEHVAASGAQVAAHADYHDLRFDDGQIDLDTLRALDRPLANVNAVLLDARHRIDHVRSPWLAGPVRTALDRFSAQIDQTIPQAQVAQQAVAVAPDMLGGSGTRHYFVMFTTEAESRGLDGLLGNWAVITASDGRLSLSAHGRSDDLSRTPGANQRVVQSPPEYVERYARFDVGQYFQDVTLSPDLPDVAQVVRQLYSGPTPHMGGPKIDGVLMVDPYALAALLSLTGPVNLPQAGVQLTTANAAHELLVDQYTEFGSNSTRLDFLDEASTETFDALTSSASLGPDTLAQDLGPAVRGRHLMFTAFRSDEQALFARLGATGAFPRAQADRDFFALVGQNKANNKTDIWMQRTVDYQVRYNPSTGHEDATAVITLKNGAPTSGYPEGVIGNNGQGLPSGTNESFLSFYSPLQLDDATVGGGETGFESQIEFGYHVYSAYIKVLSGETVTVTLHLSGALASTTRYRLDTEVQPMILNDAIHVSVTPTSGWRIDSAKGLYTVSNDRLAENVLPPGVPSGATVTFAPR